MQPFLVRVTASAAGRTDVHIRRHSQYVTRRGSTLFHVSTVLISGKYPTVCSA